MTSKKVWIRTPSPPLDKRHTFKKNFMEDIPKLKASFENLTQSTDYYFAIF